MQRYEYVPGWANVCVNVSPFCSGWDVGVPAIATVCASSSWLVHVTVDPAFTVMAAGLNAKLAMLTDVAANGLVVAAGDDGAGDAVAATGGGLVPQADSISATPAAAAASSERIVGPDTPGATGRVTARGRMVRRLDRTWFRRRADPSFRT